MSSGNIFLWMIEMPSRRRFSRIFFVPLFVLISGYSYAQCVAPNFSSPATACSGQRIEFAPNTDYTSYNWDFCSGELLQTPTGTVLNDAFGGFAGKVELAEQNGSYYGFTLTRGTGKLYRFDFQANINNPPILTQVGGLGKNSTGWRAIEIVKEGTEYVGLFIDNSGLYRVSFGSDLTSTPTTYQTIFEGSPISSPIDMAVVQEGNERYVFVSNLSNDKLVRIKFNNAFNSPTPDVTVDAITVTNSVLVSGFSFIKDCDTWYALATSVVTGALFKIAFDDGLGDTTPTLNEYSPAVTGFTAVTAGISVVYENSQYLVFAQSQNPTAAIYRVNFGNTLANSPQPAEELKNFGITGGGLWGYSMHKVGTDWLALSVENSGSNIYRVKFPNQCFSSATASSQRDHTLTTATPGSYFVTLGVTDGSGKLSSITKALTVSASSAPDIDFSFNGICAGYDVAFTSANASGGITYDWDFGDSGGSSIDAPTHQFAVGSYNVVLDVIATSTGCTNFIKHPIKVYPPPVAAFQAPSGLICTNNDFQFTTQTTDVYEGNLVYNWFVDNVPAGTGRDLTHAFTTTGDKLVKLNLSIPGCFDDEVKPVNGVLSGPEVAYSIQGQCEDIDIAFANESVGSVASYQWSFGDGGVSGNANTTHNYTSPGTYHVALSATGTNGCVTNKPRDLVIFSRPSPDFFLDLPPFSCSGSPSHFHDATPPLTDSNVNQWAWTFGDNQSGTGKDPTHTYSSAGAFNVGLTVATDKGCTAFTEHPVTIGQSPTASFTSDPTCLNKPTQFNSTSTGDIKSYLWRMGTQFYSVKDPVHQFVTAGTFTIQLSVTGNNDCVSSVSRPTTVPVAPTVDFTVANACVAQGAVFHDITTSAADPIAQRSWTFNTTGTATGQDANFTFPNTGTFPVKLEVTNQSGCAYAITRQITIHPTPVANFAMSVDVGPPPLRVSFTNTSTGASSYQWNFDDGSALRTEPSLEHTFADLGDYDVALTAIGIQGCKTSLTKTVNVVIPKDELALEEFSLVASGSSYRGYLRVHNNGNYRISGFSVTYDVGGGFLLTENVAATLNPGQTGMILLSNTFSSPAISNYICAELQTDPNPSDNKACTVLSETSVVLSPYPNPVADILTIESILPSAGTVRVSLYSSSGALAFDESFDANPGLWRRTLHVQNLSPGMYVLVVTAGTTTSSRHILIAR